MKLRTRIAMKMLPKNLRMPFLQSSGADEFFGAGAVPVNEATAVTSSAVWSAVNLLASQVAQLPLHVYRRRENGSRVRATEHPLYNVLHNSPNPVMSSFTWRETSMLWMLLRGKTVSQVQRDSMGRIRRIWPIASNRVRVEVTTSGERQFHIDGKFVPAESVLFIPGLSWDGYDGISVIQALRRVVELSINTEKYGSSFFDRGGDLNGFLKYDGVIKDEAVRRRILDQWDANYGRGPDAGHKTALLEHGLSYEKVTPSNDDAQFIETRKFQVTEVARVFRVPPHMIYELERATDKNVSAQGKEFLQYSLQPWLVRIEQAINQQLIGESERDTYYVEFDTSALQRPLLQERYTAFGVARQWGFMSVNDIRRLENMEEIGEQGDRYLEPVNMTAAGMGDEVNQGTKRAEIAGALIRAGYTPDEAARVAGLAPLEHTGLYPVTVQRDPGTDSSGDTEGGVDDET
ncbi:MAG: phage portal protein [Alkalispirochaeta sp.]